MVRRFRIPPSTKSALLNFLLYSEFCPIVEKRVDKSLKTAKI